MGRGRVRPLRTMAQAALAITLAAANAPAQLLEDPTLPAPREGGGRWEPTEMRTGHPGIAAVLNFDFARADSIFDEMERMDPASPDPVLGRGLNEWWRLVSGSGGDPELVKRLLERTRELSREYASRRGAKTNALYYSGRASSLLSSLHLINGSMMGAYRASQQSRSYLLKCLDADPDYHDAKLGLGLYHYYADALPKYLKVLGWVFGLRGDRERGLAELRDAARHGEHTRAEAMYFLTNVLSNFEGRPDSALDMIRWLIQAYPGNHVFNLEYQNTLESLGYYPEAEMNMRLALGPGGRYEGVHAVRLMLGRNLYRQARYRESAEVLESIFDGTLVAEGDPVIPWFSYFAGRARDLEGNREAAVVHYRRAEAIKTGGNASAMAKDRRENPENASARALRLARGVTRRAGGAAEAAGLWNAIVKGVEAKTIDSDVPIEQIRFREALCLEEAGRYAEAGVAFRRAAHGEVAGRALLGAARVLHRAGHVETALAMLDSLGAEDEFPAGGKARILARTLASDACTREGTILASGGGVPRHYRDTEAWRVELLVEEGGGSLRCVPMRFEEGVWRAHAPLAGPNTRYYYRVDGSRREPDPLQPWVRGEGGAVWSIAMFTDATAGTPEPSVSFAR